VPNIAIPTESIAPSLLPTPSSNPPRFDG
jgi:hypothetical protein